MSYRHNRRHKADAAGVQIVKVPTSFTVSAELLDDAPLRQSLADVQADMLTALRVSLHGDLGYPPVETPEERDARHARQEARRVEWEARRDALRAQATAYRDRIRGLTTDPIVLAVLALHEPDTERGEPVCRSCEFNGYEAEPPDWPCETWALIENMLAP